MRFLAVCMIFKKRRPNDGPARPASELETGIELLEELTDALDLVLLTDAGGRGPQTYQRPEEALVGRMLPTDVTAASPAITA